MNRFQRWREIRRLKKLKQEKLRELARDKYIADITLNFGLMSRCYRLELQVDAIGKRIDELKAVGR